MGQLPQRPVAIWCVWQRAITRPSFPPRQPQKPWPQKLCLSTQVPTTQCQVCGVVLTEHALTAKLSSSAHLASAVSLAVWPVFRCHQTASQPWISTPVPPPRSRPVGCSHQPLFSCPVSTTFTPRGHRVPPRLPSRVLPWNKPGGAFQRETSQLP